MAVVLVNDRGTPLRTRGGSAFVARNRKALAAITPHHLRNRLCAVQIATFTRETGDYWRIPAHTIFTTADEVVETPDIPRDYMAVCEAQRTLEEMCGLPHTVRRGT